MTTATTPPAPLIEVIRSFVDRFSKGNLVGACELIAPDGVFHEADSLPWSGEWVGPDGFARLISTITELAELGVAEVEIHAGEHFAVIRPVMSFTSRISGRHLLMPVLEHYTVRDGLIRRADVFYKDTHAVVDLVRNG